MSLSRREFGALAASAAVLFAAGRAAASDPSVFVTGMDLPATLDPAQTLDVQATQWALNAYDNLYRYEDNPAEMRPWLATDHTISKDGLTWDFKLRQGVKFHDGSELTAEDVVYSVQRVLGIGRAPAAPFAPILKPDSVSAPDRYTVRFTLSQTFGPFFGMIPMIAVVNSRVIKPHEENGDWGAKWLASNEAGSGAYKLLPDGYVPLEKADLERFDDHFIGWSDNPQAVKKIEWRPAKVTSTRVLALLNGTLDMTDSFLPVDQVERIEKSKNDRQPVRVPRRGHDRYWRAPTRLAGWDVLEASVLSGLKTHLMTPDLAREFAAEYHRELNRLNAERAGKHEQANAELDRIRRQITAIIAAIKDGLRTSSMKEELLALKTRKEELSTEIKQVPAPLPRLHPKLAELYRERVERLHQELNRPEVRAEAAQALRALIEEVRLIPEDGALAIELAGDLAALLNLAADSKKPVTSERDGLQVTLVAGRGFEPLTFRL
jgi:hypothetical protein